MREIFSHNRPRNSKIVMEADDKVYKTKKRKGGSEKLREKNKKLREEVAQSCSKITDMFKRSTQQKQKKVSVCISSLI